MIVVDVESIIPDADPTEACYQPRTAEFLRQIEAHPQTGDIPRFQQHGQVCTAVEAA